MSTGGNSNNTILYKFIEQLNSAIRIIDADNHIIYMNKTMIKLFGNLIGEDADMIYGNQDFSVGETTKNNKKVKTKQVYMGEALYRISSYSVVGNDQKEYTVELFRDVTEEKKTEAMAKNNYNKLLKETKFAQSIQKSILPISDVYSKSVDMRAEYLPADDLGGDMFDIFSISEDEILMYVADVSGHGIKAALLTIFLREAVRGMRETARTMGLDALLENLLKYYSGLDINSEMYMSILLCKYNKTNNELCIANAGHNCFPLILRKNGRIEEVPVKGMPITGMGILIGYDEEIIGIYPGDRILLYTDGIIEEYSESKGTEFGVIGMRNVVGEYFDLPGDKLAKKIVQEAEKHSKARAKDDRTIMVATIL